MGNSKEIRNTAEPEIRFSYGRGGVMAKLAKIGALLFLTANPDPASASLPPRTVDMSYSEHGPNNDLFYSDIEGRYTESLCKILEMNLDASLLAEFTESLDNPDKIASMASGFINLAKKYGADAELIRSILSQKNISKEDKKRLIEQAKLITQFWMEIAKEHLKNLTALYSATTDKKSKIRIEAEMKEAAELCNSLSAHGEYLSRQMSQIK